MSDRTCCVCRQPGKQVQIHHIDEDPSNNNIQNLAVLCFGCHDETMTKGGFGRKLDSDQVILYRDDWHHLVQSKRAEVALKAQEATSHGSDQSDRLEWITSLVDAYLENGEYELLAMVYHSIGNTVLMDKYVDKAISERPSDQTICYLRSLQGKPELIPHDVIERELARYEENEALLQRARFHMGLRHYREAASDYLRGIWRSLEQGNSFSAAYYLKELVKSDLTTELFQIALREAGERRDYWWQIRAFEELGWHKELRQFLLDNAAAIESSGDGRIIKMLELARDHDMPAKRFWQIIQPTARMKTMGTSRINSNSDSSPATADKPSS